MTGRHLQAGRRYAAEGCDTCRADLPPGVSKFEINLFGILNYGLGEGKLGYKVGGTYGLRTDMAFTLDDFVLVVEFDGAYWHEGREEHDYEKSATIRRGDQTLKRHEVIRIREHPLMRLSEPDLVVPKRSGPTECCQHLLVHAAHTYMGEIEPIVFRRIGRFLMSASNPLPSQNMDCHACNTIVEALTHMTCDDDFGETVWTANWDDHSRRGRQRRRSRVRQRQRFQLGRNERSDDECREQSGELNRVLHLDP